MKVFFDVDGVIIEGWHARPEYRKPWDATLEQDLGISREGLQRALFLPPKDGAESLMSVCARGEGNLRDVLSERLSILDYSGSVDTIIEYWFRKDSNINQSVLQIVKRLRQCKTVDLYLATNQEHHRAAYLWNDLNFKELFDDIFYSARLGVLKDHTEFFARINAQLDIASSEQPLFFDDTEKVVISARRVGWDAHIRNANTRRAYGRAVGDFFAWMERSDIGTLHLIQPVHVAAWVEDLGRRHAVPTVKQHLAAVRMLFDWLVTGQAVRHNPATAVRGPRCGHGKAWQLDTKAWTYECAGGHRGRVFGCAGE